MKRLRVIMAIVVCSGMFLIGDEGYSADVCRGNITITSPVSTLEVSIVSGKALIYATIGRGTNRLKFDRPELTDNTIKIYAKSPTRSAANLKGELTQSFDKCEFVIDHVKIDRAPYEAITIR